MTEQPPPDPAAATPDAIAGDADEALRERVGEDLKQGFAALGGPALADADKSRWHQRLIAITNSAKHDLPTAEARLARYWSDWEAQVGPRPG